MKMFPETFQDATKELKKDKKRCSIMDYYNSGNLDLNLGHFPGGLYYSMIQKNISVNIIFTFVSAIKNIISGTYIHT